MPPLFKGRWSKRRARCPQRRAICDSPAARGERWSQRLTRGLRPRARVDQIVKLVPQPQEAVAFGLLMRNEAPIRSSTKSISAPAM